MSHRSCDKNRICDKCTAQQQYTIYAVNGDWNGNDDMYNSDTNRDRALARGNKRGRPFFLLGLVPLDLPARKGSLTVRTAIAAVTGVQFGVSITGAFVLEETRTVVAFEGHVLGMTLSMDGRGLVKLLSLDKIEMFGNILRVYKMFLQEKI